MSVSSYVKAPAWGPTWQQLAGHRAAVHSKQPFAFAFYPMGLDGRKSTGQLLITCFQAPTSPQKGALTLKARTCVVPHNTPFAVPLALPCLLGLTSPAASFHWGTCYREATAQLKAGDRLHMALNDMLLIASCAPHTLPRTHGCFLVPNPHHGLTALLTWRCHKCCGSWGNGDVPEG